MLATGVRISAAALGCLLTATASFAQRPDRYIAIDLTPEGFVESQAAGAANGLQVGFGFGTATSGAEHALLWFGSATSAVDLHPLTGYHMSNALAASGLTQVGWATHADFGVPHAFLWSGSAATGVDLNPEAFGFSRAFGVFGDVQVGLSGGPSTGFIQHAVLWRGIAASVVDLNPAGFFASEARAASSDQQVGVGNLGRALLWTGTAESAVDLTPVWCVEAEASGVSGGQQVGRCRAMADFNDHAVLWTGSPASAVDLHPTGYVFSEARGVANGLQVGFGAPAGGPTHALVWAGTADSVMDLNQFLPEGFTDAVALGIGEQGTIVGWAREAASGLLRAFLWKPAARERVVTIDIKPGNPGNTLNPDADGIITIAILSTSDFDAFATIDQGSLTFGRTGDEASLVSCVPQAIDVNRDGAADLVCVFDTTATGLTRGDATGTLRGRTTDGQAIVGSDLIRIVPILPN
jgi:hypothetical protein